MISNSVGFAHFAAALAALLLGAIVVAAPKGTPDHRTIGAGYVAAMLVVNLTAFGVYRLTGNFGAFHALALVSLAGVAAGLLAALRRRPGWLIFHYRAMAWSYLGLLAAATTEALIRLSPLRRAIAAPEQIIAAGLAVAVVFTALGFMLFPRFERAALRQQGQAE